MSERTDEKSIYWTIVGADTNTNEGWRDCLASSWSSSLSAAFSSGCWPAEPAPGG